MVGYRRHLLELAQDVGLAGTVENMPDGSVKAHVQGGDEALTRFMEEARNPPLGHVKKLEKSEAPVKPEAKTFRIVYGELAHELHEAFGAMQRGFQDYRGDFRDFRGEFHDYREEFRGFADRTDGNFSELGDRYGEISEKLSLTLETLREESSETRRMLREAIDELKRDSAETRRELKRSVDHLVALVEKFLEV